MSRLKQNVKLLKEDLEDFKSKLDILEERIKATLDLVSNIPNAL
jgi:archaellum component FlaC